jgi:hypothetical protein
MEWFCQLIEETIRDCKETVYYLSIPICWRYFKQF